MHVPMSVHVPCKYLRLVRQGVIKVVILKELVVNNEMYIIVHFFMIMEFKYCQNLGRVVSCTPVSSNVCGCRVQATCVQGGVT